MRVCLFVCLLAFVSSVFGVFLAVQFNLGNIHKLGRLLGHEWWTVTDKDKKARERYLFLFKSRILVCKVRRISEDRSVFILKDIIKVSYVNHSYTLTLTLKTKLFIPNCNHLNVGVVAHHTHTFCTKSQSFEKRIDDKSCHN